MRITRAISSFSTYCNRVTACSALATCLVLSGAALACGPDYQHWFHVSDPSRFDPLNPKAGDSTYVFGQIFPQKAVRQVSYSARNEALNDAYRALRAALSQHRPEILFLQPDGYNDFQARHCFGYKYQQLWGDTSSIMNSIAKRIERYDIETNLPDGVPRTGYRPAFDHIPDAGALGYLAELRATGAADRYSSYFWSVRTSLTHCYANTVTQSNWPAAQQLLLRLEKIPEYETWARLGLLVGYVNDGSRKDARKMLNKLATGARGPALEPLDAEVQYLVGQYQDVLRDDAVLEHRPIFELGLSARNFGWGSCASNSLDNFLAFGIAAIETDSLSDTQVQELLTYREQLLAACANNTALADFLDTIKSDQQTPHHAYLLAATHFYLRDFNNAQKLFVHLAEQDAPWVSETSLYLVARSLLLASQSGWNGYYRDDTIDKSLALDSANAFSRYVSEYPDGRYAASAKGLHRRAHWLAGDESTYRRMLVEAQADFLDAVKGEPTWTGAEIDALQALFFEYKLRGGFQDADNTLAVLEAFVGAEPVPDAGKLQPFSRAQQFIAAYKAFAARDFDHVIEQYAGQTDRNHAELVLLARSYEMQDQVAEALEVWRSDLAAAGFAQSTIDYEVSRVLLREQGVGGVVRDEQIANVNVKRVYLASLCDGELQAKLVTEALPDETRHAVFVDLALRYLFTGNFEDLHSLLQSQPEDVIGEYSAITTAVRDIANGRSLGRAYMNVGYFLQAVVSPPLFGLENNLAQETTAQCRQNTVAAGARGPYYYYNESLRYFGDDDQSVAEQKSLYYLTMCFKQGKSSGTCLWGERPGDGLSSKEAFTRLHAKYRDSEWANKARYYY